MSVVTAVPYNHWHTATPHHDGSNKDNQERSHHDPRSRPFLYLGFMTGVLLRTVNLAVTVAVEMDWLQQVVFSLLWASAVTLLAYLAMVCVQCIAAVEAENVDMFQVTFFVGVFAALTSTILLPQVLLGNQSMLWCSLLLLVVVITCVTVRTNVQDRDEISVAIPAESLLIV